MNRRQVIVLWLALASATVYVAAASLRGVVGFALDDAWIHQVYARNLATRGEFAFVAGHPSAGSTSPLWTILLAAGYTLQLDFRMWAFWLGAVFLGLSGILGMRLYEKLARDQSKGRITISAVVGVAVVLEWHLAWSAVSGMEILLFVFLTLLLLARFYSEARPLELGVITGLVMLTRPEGLVLGALVGLGLLWRTAHTQDLVNGAFDTYPVIVDGLWYGLGLACLAVPYLLTNLAVSGTLLPNTFYAKNVEYASLLGQSPFLVRWARLVWVPFVGAQLLLVPGFVFILIRLAARKQWLALIPFAWILLLPGLYAWRLPVEYQYGRYEMPVIPLIGLYGVWGTAALYEYIPIRVIRQAWTLSAVILLLAFWGIGASHYATDVAIIDCEMVKTAQWVGANAGSNSLVAAHDIGALGYFHRRPLIDLAGLISPEVIPIMRDEIRLRDFLLERRVTYAIFFPNWYPTLASDPHLTMVHQTTCRTTREAGETNMAVYKVVP